MIEILQFPHHLEILYPISQETKQNVLLGQNSVINEKFFGDIKP